MSEDCHDSNNSEQYPPGIWDNATIFTNRWKPMPSWVLDPAECKRRLERSMASQSSFLTTPGESCYDWQPPAPPTLRLSDQDLIWLKSMHIKEKK